MLVQGPNQGIERNPSSGELGGDILNPALSSQGRAPAGDIWTRDPEGE